MNSMGERDWELYNFDNVGGSTEYDNLLINKDIDNYFNDIISKPVPQVNTSVIKTNYSLNKFYLDYIEHNLVFIVVLVGIIIFLVIRHYAKDFDTLDTSDTSDTDEKTKLANNDVKGKKKQERQERQEKKAIKSKNIEIERNKLINYKMELDREKQQILSIIDELSNINEYENNRNYYNNQQEQQKQQKQQRHQEQQEQYNQYNQYLDQDINAMYSNNYSNNQVKYLNNINNIQTMAHNDNGSNVLYENDNTSNYYDINRVQDKQTNEIDGMYIEPPFM